MLCSVSHGEIKQIQHSRREERIRSEKLCLFSSGHFLSDRECPLYFIVDKLTRRVVYVPLITRRGVMLT